MNKTDMHIGMIRSFICVFLTASLLFCSAISDACAAATTVTIQYESTYYYGPGENDKVTPKWVSHVDGQAIDLEGVPGVSRSYAYCIQPGVPDPQPGTYNVVIIDDGGSGKNARLRKMIYYLPGSYGYIKITKKRWFSGGDIDYALGHLALAYINWGDRIWNDRGSTVKSKVLQIVEDLNNLPDPPEDFEVFWIQVEGHQDLFGAFYKTEYGKASIKKESKMPQLTSGNPNYSLAGAEYTIYEDAACSRVAKTKSGANALIRTKADGTSDAIEMETGSYFIRETKAPAGYVLDSKVSTVEIVKDKTTVFSAAEIPKSNPAGLLIQKVDKETGIAKPQGAASLAGAEYTVKFYAVKVQSGMSSEQMAEAVKSREPALIGGKSAVWVFRTDEEGKVDMSRPDKYLIREKSADYYYNSANKPTFPIGIITAEETKAPAGYLLDKTIKHASITESGSSETLSTFKAFVDGNSLKEQVLRGDVCLKKAAEGRKRMAGIPFRFTSLTTGESHILITDKNGYLSTANSWNAHDNATNEGTTDEDGIWFNGYNDEKTGAKVNNSLGALPYDTYKMEELRADANEGYELIEDIITINRDRVVVDLGTYDDSKEPVPKLETRAHDKESGTNKGKAGEEITIIDEVTYSGIQAGKEYVIDGILMDKKTGKPLLDDEGKEIKGSTKFYAKEGAGTVDVIFKMKGSGLGGKDAVAFEYLKLDGKEIARHADINSKSQTVHITEPPKEPPKEPPQTPDPPAKPPTPDTGNQSHSLIHYAFIMMLAAELLLLTARRRNDRLNQE